MKAQPFAPHEIPSCSAARRALAFTLVELLVVIGIIAVLIAMLLPSLRKAQESARTAVCSSNLRQCFLGFQTYANDFRGSIPVMRTDTTSNIKLWPWFMVSGHDTADNVSMRAYIRNTVTVCPSSVEYETDFKVPDKNATSTAYALFCVSGSSQAIFRNANFQITTFIVTGPPNWTFQWQKLVRIPTHTSNTVMLGDSRVGTTGAPYFGPGHPGIIGCFSDNSNGPYWQGRINTIHGTSDPGRANVVFYDGHVDNMDAFGLRNRTESKIKYTWSRGWGDVLTP